MNGSASSSATRCAACQTLAQPAVKPRTRSPATSLGLTQLQSSLARRVLPATGCSWFEHAELLERGPRWTIKTPAPDLPKPSTGSAAIDPTTASAGARLRSAANETRQHERTLDIQRPCGPMIRRARSPGGSPQGEVRQTEHASPARSDARHGDLFCRAVLAGQHRLEPFG